MKPPRLDIVTPTTLADALAVLTERGEDARPIAGGQSLVPILAMRLATPAVLVDLNRIPALAGITPGAGGGLSIGAMTRHRAVEKSMLVATANPLLSMAMPWVAHIPIRTRGTLGGSLSHADPSAEMPAVCVACDATIVVQSPSGERTIPAEQFFRGVFETALAPGELLTRVDYPTWPHGRRAAFMEVARRHGDFAICGIATTIDLDQQRKVQDARVVAFGVGDRPLRLASVERALLSTDGGAAAIAAAVRFATDGLIARSDHHASSDYRMELTTVLTRRALTEALQ